MGDAVDSPIPRTWGLSVQLYALRRKGDGGFGDTQALEDLARVAGERGAEALAISPLHAMFANDSRRYSPYSVQPVVSQQPVLRARDDPR